MYCNADCIDLLKYLHEISVPLTWAYILKSVFYKNQNASLVDVVLMNNQASLDYHTVLDHL